MPRPARIPSYRLHKPDRPGRRHASTAGTTTSASTAPPRAGPNTIASSPSGSPPAGRPTVPERHD